MAVGRANESPAGTGASRTSEIRDWRQRGRSPRDCGARYEGAASTDHDQQAQAVTLFITGRLAASICQGDGVEPLGDPDQWSGDIRLDMMFTVNASTVTLKKNETAPWRAVSRRIVLLVI